MSRSSQTSEAHSGFFIFIPHIFIWFRMFRDYLRFYFGLFRIVFVCIPHFSRLFWTFRVHPAFRIYSGIFRVISNFSLSGLFKIVSRISGLSLSFQVYSWLSGFLFQLSDFRAIFWLFMLVFSLSLQDYFGHFRVIPDLSLSFRAGNPRLLSTSQVYSRISAITASLSLTFQGCSWLFSIQYREDRVFCSALIQSQIFFCVFDP